MRVRSTLGYIVVFIVCLALRDSISQVAFDSYLGNGLCCTNEEAICVVAPIRHRLKKKLYLKVESKLPFTFLKVNWNCGDP